jgi:hypothetical protein
MKFMQGLIDKIKLVRTKNIIPPIDLKFSLRFNNKNTNNIIFIMKIKISNILLFIDEYELIDFPKSLNSK